MEINEILVIAMFLSFIALLFTGIPCRLGIRVVLVSRLL